MIETRRLKKEYKQVTHDNVVKILHWKLCQKWGFNKAENGTYTSQKNF